MTVTVEKLTRFCLAGLFLLFAGACDDLNTPVPTAPSPIPPPRASDFNIAGHWEATSIQGRRIAFDVTAGGRVVNGRINLHHECTDGRWRVTFDGFEARIVDNAFLTTVDWENKDKKIIRVGSYTISGRFEGRSIVVGGLINSVNDIRKNEEPTGTVCTTVDVAFEGNKEE